MTRREGNLCRVTSLAHLSVRLYMEGQASSRKINTF